MARINATEDLTSFALGKRKRERKCLICTTLSPEIQKAISDNRHLGQTAINDWLKAREYLLTSRWTVRRHLEECLKTI